jgi:putative methanogenesis marker protein 17
MDAVEYFEVECPEKTGGDYYRRIADVVLLDHNLIRVVRKLHIFIDPRIPLFVAAGVTRKLPGVVRTRDFADVNVQEQKVTISLGEETYLAPLLKILWERYGKEKIEQPDRFTVIIRSEGAELKEIEDIPVYDPSESLYKDLIYAFRCIAPEGFRLRSEKFSKEKFSFVASENTLIENIDEIIRGKFTLMGEVP